MSDYVALVRHCVMNKTFIFILILVGFPLNREVWADTVPFTKAEIEALVSGVYVKGWSSKEKRALFSNPELQKKLDTNI